MGRTQTEAQRQGFTADGRHHSGYVVYPVMANCGHEVEALTRATTARNISSDLAAYQRRLCAPCRAAIGHELMADGTHHVGTCGTCAHLAGVMAY